MAQVQELSSSTKLNTIRKLADALKNLMGLMSDAEVATMRQWAELLIST